MKASKRDTVLTRPGEANADNPTRTAILDAATKLIVDRGYTGCTMRAVAEEVKIKAASVYYHFSSKDEIITEIMNYGILMLLNEVKARLDALPASASFAERLQAAVETHISCMTGSGTHYLQIYEYLPPVLKRKSRSTRDKYANIWFTLFKAAIATGDVDPGINLEIVVPYVLGGLNRVPEWYHRTRFRSEDVAGVALSILLAGLALQGWPAQAAATPPSSNLPRHAALGRPRKQSEPPPRTGRRRPAKVHAASDVQVPRR